MHRFKTAASTLAVGLLLTGCFGTGHDGAAKPFDAVMTIPAAAPARTAAATAVNALPGVQQVATTYHHQTGIMDMRIAYEPVPDRWPFDEKVMLAVSSAVKPYEAAGNGATLRIRITGPPQASATRPSSAFDASASCDGKIRTV